MEIATSPSSPPPMQEFRFDSALLDDAYHAADSSPSRNPFAFGSADDANPFLATASLTAPPSPNPFGLLPPDDDAAGAGADPFDLFSHFASAPASPSRAAAIYAQFSVDGAADRDAGDDDDDQDGGGGFQPRASYSTRTVASTVPFDWEERPGKPKHGYASSASVAGGDGGDADFDFGVLLDRSAQRAPELTTADELFDEGKIRPLKPPPRLLDSGSVGSSPRSARSAMWSPRLRGLGGPGPDFDPFAAAMANASKAPALSPLGAGAKDAAADAAADTVPMNPESVASPRSVPPTAINAGAGRKKWRLTDLLLFRRLSAKGRAGDGGNISREPVFKYSPVQEPGTPVKKISAEPKGANGAASAAGKQKKQSKYAAGAESGGGGMAAARQKQNLMGCVRLNPGLHRLAKGLNVSSTSHFGRRNGTARSTSAMQG